MSWFDTSSFSSFAKTALSQAQNLQKSIDRVLDIEEESTDAASRSSASSKHKSAYPSESSGSAKESSITRKSSSSSSSSTNPASKSSRKSSLGIVNSTGNGGPEGNSFWSSFLGDSISSTTKNNDSKTSSRRTTGRKPGSRVSGTAAGRKVRSSEDSKKVESKKSPTDSDKTLLSQEFKQHESDGIYITNTTKSQRHSPVSNSHLPQEQETDKVTEDIPERVENNVDSVMSNKGEGTLTGVNCDSQDSGVAPVEISDGSELKYSKLSSVDKNEEPAATGSHSGSLVNTSSTKASCKDLEEKEPVAVSEESLSVVKAQNEICNMEIIDSSAVLQPENSQKTNGLERMENTDSVITSQNTEEDNNLGIDNSVKLNRLPVLDSEVSHAVTGEEALLERLIEPADQHRLHKVEPLASSTPNHFSNKQSDKERKMEETPPSLHEDSGEYKELNQNEGVVNIPLAGVEENSGIETETMLDAVSVEQGEHSENIIPQKQTEEMFSEEVEKQDSFGINESYVEQEDVVEREKDTEKNSPDSAVGLQSKIKELQDEVNNLKHVVEVRESKLVELSKENVDLQETASILQSQLKQAEAALKADDEEIDDVRQEFTVRVAVTERKFQAAAKERDNLKTLLEQTEKSLNSRNERQSEEFTTLLKEKDDQIAQLLEEGEKLSKQELQINNTVKKLRAKEKENEALIKKNRKELEDLTSENARLNEILNVKEDTERKQTDAITKLNTYVEKQEEKVSKLSSELDDANEKTRSMQTALDNAYKQLADLHKENASKDSAVQEAALSAEMNAKEGLRIAMDKRERQFKKEIETLEFQISDLQTSLRRGEQQANRREDNLRQEISDLQQRLQEAEGRNQELTESVTHATRPLLRQIENLQSSYGNHTQTWERVERNLTERLNEAQIQLSEAQEKERVATEHALALNSRLTAVESQLVTYRQEKARLEATLELERTKLDSAEDARSREAARAEALEIKYRKMMEDNNVEKALLEQQLAVEMSKMETEKKRFQNAIEQKERILLRQSSLSGVPPSPSAASEVSQDKLPEASPHRMHVRQSSSGSIVDGISSGIMAGSTAMVERLQAQVKQKEGEIELLQEEISSLQKTRDSCTEELTNLTSRMENLERDSQLLAELQTRHRELEQRHNAVLQMYGEKAEECEELMMDLEDVKSMYKSQIQELLGASR